MTMRAGGQEFLASFVERSSFLAVLTAIPSLLASQQPSGKKVAIYGRCLSSNISTAP